MSLDQAMAVLKQRGLAVLVLPDALGVAVLDPAVPVWHLTRPALAFGLSIERAVEKYLEEH